MSLSFPSSRGGGQLSKPMQRSANVGQYSASSSVGVTRHGGYDEPRAGQQLRPPDRQRPLYDPSGEIRHNPGSIYPWDDLYTETFRSATLDLLDKIGSSGVRVNLPALSELVSEIFYARPATVRVKTNNATSLMDRMKLYVERTSGREWSWWPLCQPVVQLEEGEAEMSWECLCNRRRRTNVPNVFAQGFKALLYQAKVEAVRRFQQQSQSSHGASSRDAPETLAQHRASDTRKREPPSSSNSTGLPEKDDSPAKDTNQDSPFQPPKNDEVGTAIEVGEVVSGPYVFVLVKSRAYRLKNIDVGGMESEALFIALRGAYHELRGFFRQLLSVDVFDHYRFAHVSSRSLVGFILRPD
ncbi:hypothetical protein OQA88_11608 [Cercophora sp. LCS_1]